MGAATAIAATIGPAAGGVISPPASLPPGANAPVASYHFATVSIIKEGPHKAFSYWVKRRGETEWTFVSEEFPE